ARAAGFAQPTFHLVLDTQDEIQSQQTFALAHSLGSGFAVSSSVCRTSSAPEIKRIIRNRCHQCPDLSQPLRDAMGRLYKLLDGASKLYESGGRKMAIGASFLFSDQHDC